MNKEVLRRLGGFFSVAIGHSRLDRSKDSQSPASPRSDTADVRSLARKYDRSRMAQVIEATPSQIEYALADPHFPELPYASYDKAVVLGMGGSALPVDVLNDAFEGNLAAPVFIQRHYTLPLHVDDRTLIVLSSFSGNTEETLAPLAHLPSNAKNVVILTAGGHLGEVGRERGYPLIRIPREREVEAFQPRCATGYMVTYLARLLMAVGLLEDSRTAMESLITFLRARDLRKEAESIAHWLAGRIPVFYTDQTHERSIGRIAKIKFNENAKRPAFFSALPEANHNEMVGFSRPFGKFAFLYFRDPDSLGRIHERFDVMRAMFADKSFRHIDFRQWEMPGSTRLEKIFSSLLLADWVSYSVALLDHIDPTPVDLVEGFKQALGTRPEPHELAVTR